MGIIESSANKEVSLKITKCEKKSPIYLQN